MVAFPRNFVGTGTARPNGREASVHNCDQRSHNMERSQGDRTLYRGRTASSRPYEGQ